jgi:Tat protein translocase TatB subunit
MFEFGGSLQEILVILVIALLVVGPKRLPEVGRMLARALRELRSASDEFRSTLETHLEMNEPVVTPPAPAQPHQGATSPSVATEPVASPTVQPPTAEPADDEFPTPYFAQRGGRLFHRRGCRWASRIARNARVGFPGAADAEREGFVACPACEHDGAGDLSGAAEVRLLNERVLDELPR